MPDNDQRTDEEILQQADSNSFTNIASDLLAGLAGAASSRGPGGAGAVIAAGDRRRQLAQAEINRRKEQRQQEAQAAQQARIEALNTVDSDVSNQIRAQVEKSLIGVSQSVQEDLDPGVIRSFTSGLTGDQLRKLTDDIPGTISRVFKLQRDQDEFLAERQQEQTENALARDRFDLEREEFEEQKRQFDAEQSLEREKRANAPANKVTPAQRQAASFATRTEEANGTIKELEEIGTKRDFSLGFNFLKSDDRQKFEQASQNFINATLRRESGAAISEDEFATAERQYIPQVGDSQAVLDQKSRNRQVIQAALAAEAGPEAIAQLIEQLPNPAQEPVADFSQVSDDDLEARRQELLRRRGN